MKKHILRGIVGGVLAMAILICGYAVGRGGFIKSVTGEKSRLCSLADEIYSEEFDEHIDQIGEIGGEWVLKSFEFTAPLPEIVTSDELTAVNQASDTLYGERIIIDDKDYSITLQGQKYAISEIQITGGIVELIANRGYDRGRIGIFIGGSDCLYFWEETMITEFLNRERTGMYHLERVTDD